MQHAIFTMTSKVSLNVRITRQEAAALRAFAERYGRTVTDVVRELIRQIEERMPL